MKKYFIFFLVISVSFVFGQKNTVDTIKVVTLQDFNIPTVFHHVTKVSNLDIEVFKSTSNGTIKVSSKNFAFNQTPTDRELKTLTDEYHGLGPSVQIIVNGFLQEIGDYKITIRLKSLGDFHEPNPIKSKTFFVKVGYPKLLSLGALANTYFLGDKTEFNLAMSGLDNKTDYSYIILDWNTEDTLKIGMETPVVKIDGELVHDNKEKEIKLVLLYKNLPFNFLISGSDQVFSSQFNQRIKIVKPKLEVVTNWSQNDKDFVPITLDNPKSLEIDFRYFGGYLPSKGYYKFIELKTLTTPLILNSGENNSSDIFEDIVKLAKIENSGFGGKKIVLEKTTKFRELPMYKVYKTIITIKFRTQYENIVRKFSASVYK